MIINTEKLIEIINDDVEATQPHTLVGVSETYIGQVKGCHLTLKTYSSDEAEEERITDLTNDEFVIEDGESSHQFKRQHELVTLVEEKDFLGQLKAPLIGEHSIDVECSCSACDFEGPDEDCEVCQGDINYIKNVTIDWTTQKEIITAALHELGFKVEKMN